MGLYNWKEKLRRNGYLKPVGTTLVVTGLGWLLYQVDATVNTLKTIGHAGIISRKIKYIEIDANITEGLVLGQEGYLEHKLDWRKFVSWLHRCRHWRLLQLAQAEDPQTRSTAVARLANSYNLSESELIQVAQACDAHTAVGLARCHKTHKSLFLQPPSMYKANEREELTFKMRDVLYAMNQDRSHLCVKYFLSKAFPEYEKQSNYLLDAEVMLTEPWTILTSQDNLLPLCVQALDHHVSTLNNETLLVELGGIPLLMAVYQHLKDNPSVSKMLCRIMTRICSHPEVLPQLFASGWVGVLAGWMASSDEYLSLLANHCLANLDRDEATHALYGRHTMPLHPMHRSFLPHIDVVFVHGLLGGVLSTWRQRGHSYFPSMGFQKEDMAEGSTQIHSSDRHTEEYLRTMTDLTLAQWDQLGSDFEFVVSDFPTSSKVQTYQQYTLSGKDHRIRQYGTDKTYTNCWPRDWLPKDCPSIRVLGIDYESRISEWFPTCTENLRVKTLEERAAVVLEELKKCGIGRRPIVWVAHSMGGLLVKKMLTEALSSCDYKTRRIAHNSKAVVFLSTPHLGCPLANMNDILNYLLWPSTEVEELRHDSVVLNELHENFHEFLQKVNIKIVTFAEAESTRILNLGVHIVPPEFSYFDVGDLFEMPCDHACVAKPYNRLSFIYQTVLNLIKNVHEETLHQPCLDDLKDKHRKKCCESCF